MSYVLLLLEVAESRGVDRSRFPDTPASHGDGDGAEGRVALASYRSFCLRALELTRDPGLGLEFGLRAPITAHGLFGFGLLSQPTLRDAFDFIERFASPLRLPAWHVAFRLQGDEAVIEAVESVRHEPLHIFASEQLLASVATVLQTLVPGIRFRLCFDYPEPEHFNRYRHRLPPAHFDAGATQIRIERAFIDQPLAYANPVAARLASEECAREANTLSPKRDIVTQVLQTLSQDTGSYPGLEEVASALHLSPRTLTRRLKERDSSFRQLLDEVRRRDSLQLLRDPTLSQEEIAAQLGYSSGANFARAFQSWTGSSPGRFREHLLDAASPAKHREADDESTGAMP